MLDLSRENIDAADNKHIVASALGSEHLDERSAAGAFLMRYCGNVAGSVSEQRKSFFADTCEHELAVFAVGQRLEGHGIDYLGIEIILAYMHSALLAAFKCNAGTRYLRETVYIICLDFEHILKLGAHVLAPRLCAENTYAKRQLNGIDIHLFECLCDKQSV